VVVALLLVVVVVEVVVLLLAAVAGTAGLPLQLPCLLLSVVRVACWEVPPVLLAAAACRRPPGGQHAGRHAACALPCRGRGAR
jgi:hypothetical protein